MTTVGLDDEVLMEILTGLLFGKDEGKALLRNGKISSRVTPGHNARIQKICKHLGSFIGPRSYRKIIKKLFVA